ncbi:MAG: hypothetical protein K1X79_01105 [Oligoflexia bacterium]|nr:hypothetical protein [Oligoflexia bacterium]
MNEVRMDGHIQDLNRERLRASKANSASPGGAIHLNEVRMDGHSAGEFPVSVASVLSVV